MNKALLTTLYENPVFVQLVEEMKKTRPIVPMYDWSKDNIEEVKAKSLIQQGYDRAMIVINPFGDIK